MYSDFTKHFAELLVDNGEIRLNVCHVNQAYENFASESQNKVEDERKQYCTKPDMVVANTNDDDQMSSDEEDVENAALKAPITHIIIDCSALNYIDTVGIKAINQVINANK